MNVMMETNKKIADIFKETVELLNIKGDSAFRINGYLRSIYVLEHLDKDVADIYEEKGLKGFREAGFGEKNASKIEQFIKKGKIKEYEELQEETAVRQVVTHYFESKGIGLQELKNSAKKRKIIYSRFTKPAKQLIELAGSVDEAKKAITTVAKWANSRKLDYAIETVFKKWLELDRLKPKEVVKKPFYRGDPMVRNEMKKKWFVVTKSGEWLEFADKESTIEWKIMDK
jgi:DNA polymerase/3'-5' exonuclease PolX